MTPDCVKLRMVLRKDNLALLLYILISMLAKVYLVT